MENFGRTDYPAKAATNKHVGYMFGAYFDMKKAPAGTLEITRAHLRKLGVESMDSPESEVSGLQLANSLAMAKYLVEVEGFDPRKEARHGGGVAGEGTELPGESRRLMMKYSGLLTYNIPESKQKSFVAIVDRLERTPLSDLQAEIDNLFSDLKADHKAKIQEQLEIIEFMLRGHGL